MEKKVELFSKYVPRDDLGERSSSCWRHRFCQRFYLTVWSAVFFVFIHFFALVA